MMDGRVSLEAGFSLIEALVALVILAVAGIALVGATETHIIRITALEDRAAAQWVAENRLAELAAGILPARDADATVSMMGADWALRQGIDATDDPDLLKVEVIVSAMTERGSSGDSLSRMTGFILREEP